jgi:hypothetical protein
MGGVDPKNPTQPQQSAVGGLGRQSDAAKAAAAMGLLWSTVGASVVSLSEQMFLDIRGAGFVRESLRALPTLQAYAPPSERMVALFSKGKLPMPDDDRDFIERANSVAEKLHGEPMTTEEIADSFALFGLQKRKAALEKFDTELRGEIDSSPHSLRRRVQLMALRKKMGGVHEALRKARR